MFTAYLYVFPNFLLLPVVTNSIIPSKRKKVICAKYKLRVELITSVTILDVGFQRYAPGRIKLFTCRTLVANSRVKGLIALNTEPREKAKNSFVVLRIINLAVTNFGRQKRTC